MSLLSPIMKDVAHLAPGIASPGLLFPLSTLEVAGPTYRRLEDWLQLPIDERAPAQSVAIVEIVNRQFIAVVIDTVADLPLWWIREPRESLARLHEGMLGMPGAPSRGTLIVSAPRSPPGPAQPSAPGEDGPGPASTHCQLCQVFALPSDSGSTGPGGDPAFLRRLAQLLSRVGQASHIKIGDNGTTQLDAAFVSNA